MKKIIPLLHPKRQTGSDRVWYGDFSENEIPVMLVDKSDKRTLNSFLSMIDEVLTNDPSITHLSIHATKGEGWDWTNSDLNVGQKGKWVLLKGVDAVTLDEQYLSRSSLENKMTKGEKSKAVQAATRQPDLEYSNRIVLPLLGKSFYLNAESQVKSNGPSQLVIPDKFQANEIIEYPLVFGDKIISCAPGLAVILGGTGSGKSTILDRAIATGLGESAVDYQRLLHLEDGPMHEMMSATDQTFFYQLLTFLQQQEEQIILVDSISEWFTRSEGGNTGKGGVNTRIPFDLRVLNYAAMRTGKLVIAALNPGDRDDEVISSLVNDLAASVRLVVHIKNEKEVAFTTLPRRLELYYRYGDTARTIMETMIDLSQAKRDESSMSKKDDSKDDVIVLDLESESETTLASLVRLLKGNE